MASPPAPDFGRLLAQLTRALNARDIPFMLIGGQAVLLHGRPRLTEDIDVTLGVPPSELPALQAVCLSLGLTALPEDVEAFVRETFVLPVKEEDSGIRVDFVFSTTPYERAAIDRAQRIAIAGEAVPFATAEDLIIHKLFAGRAIDWEDVVSVVRRKGQTLDWQYIDTWAAAFAEVPGRNDLPARVDRLRRDAGL